MREHLRSCSGRDEQCSSRPLLCACFLSGGSFVGGGSGSVRTKVLSKDGWLLIALLSQRRDELRRANEGADARLCAPCVVAARSRLFSSWLAAWIYVRENAVRIRGGMNGAKTCNSVMKNTLMCEPRFHWSSAVDLMCRKLTWMNYRCFYCAALMQLKAV